MISVLLRAVLAVLPLVVLQGCSTLSGRPLPAVEPIAVRAGLPVPRYEVFEVALRSAVTYTNPFTEVSVQVTFKAPDGRERVANAFHDGDNIWRARISPDVTGRWTYQATASNSSDSGLNRAAGAFDCTDSSSHGFVRPDPVSKYRFSFSDRTRFFGVGDTSYGVVSGISEQQLTAYLDKRSSQQFNFIRFFAAGFPYMAHKTLPIAQAWPWGGTPQEPDFDRLNPAYFQRLEQLLAQLKQRDMYAEILLLNYYSLPFTDPDVWTPERESLWIQQVVARLSALRHVFLWTVTNEYEVYPRGKYKYDGASDDEWVKRVGALVQRIDPHHHPVTVHNVTFDGNGGVGGRFGVSPNIDVISQQSWGRALWQGKYLEGDAQGIEVEIATDRIYDKPVINTENGYEWLSRHSNYRRQSVSTDKARRAAWRVLMAGGAAYAAGFGGTWHGSDDYVWNGDGPLYFRLRDMGLGAQIKHLVRFASDLDADDLQPVACTPAPNLCLAAPGRRYVVYAPMGGSVEVDLSDQPGRMFDATRLDPKTGRRSKIGKVAGGSRWASRRYGKGDWVLHLQTSDIQTDTKN